MKKEQKQQAIVLRERGFSLSEISQKLGISKSTASLWLRNVQVPAESLQRLYSRTLLARQKAVETNRQKRRIRVEEILLKVKTVIGEVKMTRELGKLCCAMLFWGEGSKTTRTVIFTNSDPEMIRVFMKLMRWSFKLNDSKFRIRLHLHEYHDERKQKKFWSKASGLPLSKFTKIYLKRNTGKSKKEGYPGCACISYHDVNVAIELDLLRQVFSKKI